MITLHVRPVMLLYWFLITAPVSSALIKQLYMHGKQVALRMCPSLSSILDSCSLPKPGGNPFVICCWHAGTAHLPRQLYNDGVAAAQEWSNRRKSIDELLNRLLEQQHSAAAAQVRPHTRRAGATRSGRLIKVGKSLL